MNLTNILTTSCLIAANLTHIHAHIQHANNLNNTVPSTTTQVAEEIFSSYNSYGTSSTEFSKSYLQNCFWFITQMSG